MITAAVFVLAVGAYFLFQWYRKPVESKEQLSAKVTDLNKQIANLEYTAFNLNKLLTKNPANAEATAKLKTTNEQLTALKSELKTAQDKLQILTIS
ncbi:hypothetical protein MYP_632 [Sporocytophaga myxococcoides]|uniref:Uncharacterized protein n=2 Tax=Sporocytophaga myxococcoides TaxID=153721 RepID=A0A098L955_9BACT|nr:hypothetical protein MYP_632 [Sporocytophaga myxococcoides]